MVIKRPGFMSAEWENFVSKLSLDSWLATIMFVLVTPFFLSYVTKHSPREKNRISLHDSYILTLGAIAFQGKYLIAIFYKFSLLYLEHSSTKF